MFTTIKNLLILSVLIISCNPDDLEEIEKPLFYVPEGFPEPTYALADKPVTEEGFELGRKLFYDGILSRDGSIACASCHHQSAAFTHHGHDISHGIDDRLGNRNTPSIVNMAFLGNFFWDGGVHDLDFVSLNPIENPVEMDDTPENIVSKLNDSETYRKEFEKVYGGTEITLNQVLLALSQFQLALVSTNSKYDQYVRGEASFTAKEKAGLKLFETNCSQCHKAPLFTDNSFRNNGIELYLRDSDFGRYSITLDSTDKYKYKVPTLRNIALTGPYMHDGRFRTLSSVLNHYINDVEETPNLDPLLKGENGALGISLNAEEKENLLLFLETLTDEEFISDPRFSVPSTAILD